MRAPLNWLKSFTPLAAVATERQSVRDLGRDLDALGLVVEGISFVGEGLEDVVLSRVLEISAIEGADRIRKVSVDLGGETTEVVCGAWNFEVGDVVPYIGVGGRLPGGMRIETRTMRGVTSNGMLCSPRELELADDHAGIMILARPGRDGPVPAGMELGEPLAEHLGITPDAVFDLAVEPNRPDCLSMLGVARDLAAHYGLPLEVPEPAGAGGTALPAGPRRADELASVRVESPELCRRLTARVLTGVTIVPSPPLVQRRLTLAGMRPINSAVDASNYAMLELGQPTHPYDLDELGGHGLVARAAHHGESLVTLDGETRLLGTRPVRGSDPVTALDCVICNANDVPVGIGGVMGGHSSEISDATTSILLEAALFVPVAVGRTARHLGLRSEASVRFERGVDPDGLERASLRVCELIAEAAVSAGVAPAQLAPGMLDDVPVPFERTRVTVRPGRVNSLLGTELDPAEMRSLLEPIGYAPAGGPGETAGAGPGGSMTLVVPSWRPDVTREVDVIEDVARTFGYRRIPRSQRRSPFVGRLAAVQQLRRRARRVLMGLGAHECWTSSIVDPSGQALVGLHELVRLANPMVAEESALRGGLMAGLLAALRHNSGHRNPWLRLFEVGDVFGLRPAADGTGDAEGTVVLEPDERERLALVLAFEADSAATAVQAWRVLSDALGIVGVDIVQADPGESARHPAMAGLHLARSARLVVSEIVPDAVVDKPGTGLDAGTLLGTVGEIDPAVAEAFGLPHERIGWLELNLHRLEEAPRRPMLASPVSRFPSSDVDLAFVLDEAVPAARLEQTLRLAAGELCERLQLFDVYRGPGLPEGQRSLAYRLRFCALDHTLTDAEVAEVRRRCIDAVEEALPAVLRG